MAHPAQPEYKQDRREQITKLDEVRLHRRLLVFLFLLWRRLALEHPQHAVSENEAADDVSRRTDYRDESEDRAHGGVVRACSDQRTDE